MFLAAGSSPLPGSIEIHEIQNVPTDWTDTLYSTYYYEERKISFSPKNLKLIITEMPPTIFARCQEAGYLILNKKFVLFLFVWNYNRTDLSKPIIQLRPLL